MIMRLENRTKYPIIYFCKLNGELLEEIKYSETKRIEICIGDEFIIINKNKPNIYNDFFKLIIINNIIGNIVEFNIDDVYCNICMEHKISSTSNYTSKFNCSCKVCICEKCSGQLSQCPFCRKKRDI